MLAPKFFNSLIKSIVSGSIDAFSTVVVPDATQAAMMVFCVAPTDIFGKVIEFLGARRPVIIENTHLIQV